MNIKLTLVTLLLYLVFCVNSYSQNYIDPIYATTSKIIGLKDGKVKVLATGFFYIDDKKNYYLVTNKHVVFGENFAKNVDPIVDQIKLNLHLDPRDLTKNGDLIINIDENTLLTNKTNEKIDIVLIKIDIDRTKYFFIPVDKTWIDSGNILVGIETIFVLGYPYGWYDEINNLPINRVGHLSSPFRVPFQGDPKMLGDVETHRGMSGGPVFMILKDYTEVSDNTNTKMMGSRKTVLVGVHSGQPTWELINKTKGTKKTIDHTLIDIWFADLILEILN